MPNHSPISDLTGHIWPPPEVCIVGAGIGGLVTAILCQRATIPYVILEKLDEKAHGNGADIGLHSNAISILTQLGIPDSFWYQHSYSVDKIHYCAADQLPNTPPSTNPLTKHMVNNDMLPSKCVADSCSTLADTSPISSFASIQLTPLRCNDTKKANHPIQHYTTTLNQYQNEFGLSLLNEMVTSDPIMSLSMTNMLGRDQVMRVCNRQSLMRELLNLVPKEKILFRSVVLQCSENENHAELIFTHQHAFASLLVPIVIGADGISSACRNLTTGQPVPNPTPTPFSLRYKGEICYRGTFHSTNNDSQHTGESTIKQFVEALIHKNEYCKPNSLCLYQNKRLRFAFGFLNRAHSSCYWWVCESWNGTYEQLHSIKSKHAQLLNPPPHWPKFLHALYLLTNPADFYFQPHFDRIADSNPTSWYSNRCVLLGDAAHPSTPILFQATNMAIEDAHLLISLLKYYPPSVCTTTIFSQYAKIRSKHVSQIQKMSVKHMKLLHMHLKSPKIMKDVILKLVPTQVIEHNLHQLFCLDTNGDVRHVIKDDNVSIQSSLSISRSSKRWRRFSAPVFRVRFLRTLKEDRSSGVESSPPFPVHGNQVGSAIPLAVEGEHKEIMEQRVDYKSLQFHCV